MAAPPGTQRPGVDWVKGYSFSKPSLESHPHAGVETKDGGFLMVGDGIDYAESNPRLQRHLLVAKLDINGTLLWELDLGDRGALCLTLVV